ncbi:uncharacterized protein EI90DRAFT_3038054 [Cantharellus anzutake]|uniref:uncharacterized protein n=1 Tax=Cantharellus anzutake TaxID=1750568 RepID=UPI001903D07F|nr:uncharacterized protein EI90DRAFT_3038054 [Cantharellus anzutake]KAF8339864.1 hypothetical protein EI90DRAFT_3038054 [Cantharellus anzutake]
MASSELTVRAVCTGLGVGCLLCFTNLYFGLQTGEIVLATLNLYSLCPLYCDRMDQYVRTVQTKGNTSLL